MCVCYARKIIPSYEQVGTQVYIYLRSKRSKVYIYTNLHHTNYMLNYLPIIYYLLLLKNFVFEYQRN